MRFIRGFVHLLATPVFWGLAVLLWLNGNATQAMMTAMDMAPVTLKVAGHDLGANLSDILSSMWLMYALMGVFHLGPWLDLLAPRNSRTKT